MALSPLQLAALDVDDPKPKKPEPGLTGADLELAHANREFDTADKVAQQASHDVYHTPAGFHSETPFQNARARSAAAVNTMQQSIEDQANIRALIAALSHRK